MILSSMEIKTLRDENGDYIYKAKPFLKKPRMIIVKNDAPQEAHDYAKQELLFYIKADTIKSKTGRFLEKFGWQLQK